MILADHVGEPLRSQAVGERAETLGLRPRAGEEIAHRKAIRRMRPLRSMVRRQNSGSSPARRASWSVLVTSEPFTATTMSPRARPTRAAGERRSTSVTTTPVCPRQVRPMREATAGERLATVAPWKGEGVSMVRAALGVVSGGGFRATVTERSRPLRLIVSLDSLPTPRVARR